MSFLARRPRSAVAHQLCGRSQLVDMYGAAGLMGLGGEEAPAATPAGAATDRWRRLQSRDRDHH